MASPVQCAKRHERAPQNRLQPRLPGRLLGRRPRRGRARGRIGRRPFAPRHERLPLLANQQLPPAAVLAGAPHLAAAPRQTRLLGRGARFRRPGAVAHPRRIRARGDLPLPKRRQSRRAQAPERLLLREARTGDHQARRHLLWRGRRGADARLRRRGLARHLRPAHLAQHHPLGKEPGHLLAAPGAGAQRCVRIEAPDRPGLAQDGAALRRIPAAAAGRGFLPRDGGGASPLRA